MTNKFMTNREICLKAAARLREVGWRQSGFGDRDGPHCMIGACRWAAGWYDHDIPANAYPTHSAASAAFAAATSAVGVAAYGSTGRVRADDWNDEPGRTMEEVIAALETCP